MKNHVISPIAHTKIRKIRVKRTARFQILHPLQRVPVRERKVSVAPAGKHQRGVVFLQRPQWQPEGDEPVGVDVSLLANAKMKINSPVGVERYHVGV